MYELVAAVLVLAGIQYTFAWRFHSIYIGLHDKFANAVRDAQARRFNEFEDRFFSFLTVVGKDLKGKDLSSLSKDDIAKISAKKEYLDGITELAKVIEVRERIGDLYEAARDSAKAVYVFLMVSGTASFLGLLPATGLLTETFLYGAFGLPLLLVLSAWSDYHRYEGKLVKLRDEPIVGAGYVSQV